MLNSPNSRSQFMCNVPREHHRINGSLTDLPTVSRGLDISQIL